MNSRMFSEPGSSRSVQREKLATAFSVLLAVAAAYSTRKRPLRLGESPKSNLLLTWSVLALPFIVIEAATGMLSFSVDYLRIPPIIGWGAGIDCLVLAVGLSLSIGLARQKRRVEGEPGRPEHGKNMMPKGS